MVHGQRGGVDQSALFLPGFFALLLLIVLSKGHVETFDVALAAITAAVVVYGMVYR